MSQVTRAASKLKFETGDRPTQSDFTDLHDSVLWYDEQSDFITSAYQLLGGSIKSQTLGLSVSNITTTLGLTDGLLMFIPVYLKNATTITGAKFMQAAQGAYTADSYNGIGLYSYSGGTLTLVASSTDDGNIWKAATTTWVTKAFSSPYNANTGIYFLGFLYNSSSQSSQPSIGQCPIAFNLAVHTVDLTNSAKLFGSLSGQTSLPASVAMSSITSVVNRIYAAIY